jgi:hypothetical protein
MAGIYYEEVKLNMVLRGAQVYLYMRIVPLDLRSSTYLAARMIAGKR